MSRCEVIDDCRCAADVRARNRHVMMLRKRSYGRAVVPKLKPPPEPEPLPPIAVEPVVEIPKFEPLPASAIRLIIAAAAQHFGLEADELYSTNRKRGTLVQARWVAIHLARKLTTRSLPDIGRRFGLDHSTILHALLRMEEMLAADPDIVAACREIEKKVTSRIASGPQQC